MFSALYAIAIHMSVCQKRERKRIYWVGVQPGGNLDIPIPKVRRKSQ